jgi:hypothetical protein
VELRIVIALLIRRLDGRASRSGLRLDEVAAYWNAMVWILLQPTDNVADGVNYRVFLRRSRMKAVGIRATVSVVGMVKWLDACGEIADVANTVV